MDRKLDRLLGTEPDGGGRVLRQGCLQNGLVGLQGSIVALLGAARPHKCAAFASKTSLYKIIAFCCGAL